MVRTDKKTRPSRKLSLSSMARGELALCGNEQYRQAPIVQLYSIAKKTRPMMEKGRNELY